MTTLVMVYLKGREHSLYTAYISIELNFKLGAYAHSYILPGLHRYDKDTKGIGE